MVAKTDTAAKNKSGEKSPGQTELKQVKIRYFAMLKEERGLSEETIETGAPTLRDLYCELKEKHGFHLDVQRLRVAVKDQFVDFDSAVEGGSEIVFIPPVAGG